MTSDFIKTMEEDFEEKWEEYYQAVLKSFNRRHTTSFMRWLTRQDFLDKNSMEHKVQKSQCRLFFARGVNFEQEVILNKKKYDFKW